MVSFLMALSEPQFRFQGHDIILRQITRKWCKIKLYLKWQTKVVYDLSIGAIFNDLERPPNPHFKVTPIFDVYVVIFIAF